VYIKSHARERLESQATPTWGTRQRLQKGQVGSLPRKLIARTADALSEAHDLLESAVHGWLLAVHDCMVAWNLALSGRLDDAEPTARSSVERFDAQGEVWCTVDPLSILAGIAEARGDLDGASAAYEALLERCRAAEQRGYMVCNLFRLAALRGRQGDDDADGLYEEAIACSFNRSVSADAMVGQAAVARRPGAGTGAARRGRHPLPELGPSCRPDRCARWPGVVVTRRGQSRRRDGLRR